MKLDRLCKFTAAGLAYLGTVVPWAPVLADQPAVRSGSTGTPRTKAPAKVVIDVRLNADGTLRGELFDAKKTPVSQTAVSVRLAVQEDARREVARVTTGENGAFEVRDLKPGIYYIIGGTGHGVYRVWSEKAAPPAALSKVQMVSDMSVVRAQGPNGQPGGNGQVLYDENGVAYGQVRIVDTGGLQPVGPGMTYAGGGGGGFLNSIGIFDAAVLGAGAAGLTLGIIGLNEANKANDKVDQLSKSP